MKTHDEGLSEKFAARCEEARSGLRLRMAEYGLREQDGWRIHEFTRQVIGHTELVMRPIHRTLAPPPNLECMCSIDEPGSHIKSECRD